MAPKSHKPKKMGTFPLQYLKIIEGVLKRPVPIILFVINEMHENVPSFRYLALSCSESLRYAASCVSTVGMRVGMAESGNINLWYLYFECFFLQTFGAGEDKPLSVTCNGVFEAASVLCASQATVQMAESG